MKEHLLRQHEENNIQVLLVQQVPLVLRVLRVPLVSQDPQVNQHLPALNMSVTSCALDVIMTFTRHI